MTTSLIEYHWNNVNYSLSNTFTFSLDPSLIQKNVKCEWRVRHRGFKNYLKKVRWRYRRTEVYKIEGVIETELERLKLEALASRNSKLKLVTDMKSTQNEGTDFGAKYPTSESDVEDAYFIITDAQFTAPPEGNYYQYSITLERVDTEGIE